MVFIPNFTATHAITSTNCSIILYDLLLITRQAAQLICLGCTINNSAVHVTINESMYLCRLQLATKCEVI